MPRDHPASSCHPAQLNTRPSFALDDRDAHKYVIDNIDIIALIREKTQASHSYLLFILGGGSTIFP